MAERFGHMVRDAREGLGLSREELARLVGVSRVQISRIEAESRTPGTKTLSRLVEQLHLDPAAVLHALEAQAA